MKICSGLGSDLRKKAYFCIKTALLPALETFIQRDLQEFQVKSIKLAKDLGK